VLFPGHLHEPIRRGEVTLAFRRWRRPTVSQGRTLQSPAGVLAIDELTPISEADITDADARAAGSGSVADVLDSLAEGEHRTLYRIRFHRVGDDPRTALRADAELDDAEIEAIDAQLDRWDAASRAGPWTADVLRLIAASPAEPARVLAAATDVDRLPFKRRVRQLKGLGLTESLETGYRLSPRGQAYLGRTRR
jgi:hypothetical protein